MEQEFLVVSSESWHIWCNVLNNEHTVTGMHAVANCVHSVSKASASSPSSIALRALPESLSFNGQFLQLSSLQCQLVLELGDQLSHFAFFLLNTIAHISLGVKHQVMHRYTSSTDMWDTNHVTSNHYKIDIRSGAPSFYCTVAASVR